MVRGIPGDVTTSPGNITTIPGDIITFPNILASLFNQQALITVRRFTYEKEALINISNVLDALNKSYNLEW